MKIKFYIPKMDDSSQYYNTSFLMRVSGVKHEIGRPNQLGETVIRCSRLGIGSKESKKLDPANENIATYVKNIIMPKPPRYSKYNVRDNSSWDRWTTIITFKRKDGDAMMWIQKNNSVYSLNSKRMNLEDISRAIAKVIYRSCFDRSAESLESYIDKVVLHPTNVLYAIENRTPYQFWDEGRKVTVRINTKLIGEDEAALEISEGIWGSICIKDLNSFINVFGLGSSRSKTWYRITPKKLWAKLMGSQPSESQHKLMIAWLMQNRTQLMVENRAKALLVNLEKEYDNIYMIYHERNMGLFVRGKEADWIIADAVRGTNSNHQKVNTFFWSGEKWAGPICIDNLHVNSSVGDQLAARAMMLLNDTQAGEMIYTIRSLAPISKMWRGKHRFNISKLHLFSAGKPELHLHQEALLK